MGHNRNLADYAHHFDGTNIDLGSGNIETEGVLTYEDVTNVDAIGIITARAGVKVPDSQNISLGTGNDFAITHDGTNTTFINDTGQIQIRNRADDQDIILQTDDGSGGVAVYLRCDGSSGQVDLNHYGSRKFYTSSTGATVNGTLVSDGVTSELDLSAISSSISDTAVDIFVYDTRKDSDGGAWRKRTQYTSWYNETLNTSTRGSRKEFPAVAVIVTETSQVTIYDGDDPDLPMWMVFNSGSGNALSYNNGAKSTVMLNGKLANAAAGSNQRFRTIDFLSDSHLEYSHTDGRTTFNINISQRNAGAGSFNYGNVSGSGLINRDCEDVAMKVLPNALIDDATGLPVPTIAVGTRDGLSIIKDDGSVIDYTHQNGTYDYTSFVEFLGDDRVAYAWDNDTTPRRLFITPVRSTDTATVTSTSYPRDIVDTVGYGRPTDSKVVGNYHGHLVGHDQSVAAGMNGSMIAVGDGSDGLNLVDVQAAGDDTFNSRIAFISKDYNTGWQYGNIKGAFLSDTSTSQPSEIIVNGTFDSNIDGWSSFNSILSHQTDAIRVADNGSWSKAYQSFTTVVGRVYQVKITIKTISGNAAFAYAGAQNPAQLSGNDTAIFSSITSTGTYYGLFTATATTSYIEVTSDSTSYVEYSLISVKEAVQDRSVNNKGLQVYGTVTKSAVATGAELVAYSGWSTSNYLEQPINTDMNVGTGDFYVMGWIYPTSNTTGYVWEYAAPSNGSGYTEMFYHNSGVLRFYIEGGTPAEKSVSLNVWQHFVCVRRSGQIYLYVNGVSSSAVSDTAALDNTSAKLRIGIRAYAVTAPFYGKIALVRMGASAPSAEQIKKIYEDEKFLFQENAAATLYGSSDAVTALAYDEVTDRLHVGTSSGRSDLQGLRRINNTTTAVTTAISAHDEFIIEQ